MQISPISYNNPCFSGSFKVNADDYLPDCDNLTKEKMKLVHDVAIKQPIIPPKSPVNKTMTLTRGDRETSVEFFEAPYEDFIENMPQNIKRLCDFHAINPSNDLFMIGGKNAQNRRFIIFNSFYYDKATDTDYEQLYCLKSPSEELTQPQESVIRIFSDPFNARYFKFSSQKNPLQDIASDRKDAEILLDIVLENTAYLSKKMNISDAFNEKGKIYPIIYSADSQYVRYKVYSLDDLMGAISQCKNC